MRKIVVFNLISVDGYFAGLDGNIDWHNTNDEFNSFAAEQTKSFGTIFFGRTTYKMFEDYWPKALIDPSTSDDDRQIAQSIEDATKIVFSKKLKDVAWSNTKLFHEITPEKVHEWKRKESTNPNAGKDAVIFGSGTIVRQFAKLGLIDEYRLLVNPIVLGKGKLMFENIDETKLYLVESRAFGNGNVLLRYVPLK